MEVNLISVTDPKIFTEDNQNKSERWSRRSLNSEELIAYCARVSNPSNQMNMETAPRLLKYLIKHKHWSPFEMVDMCVEIKTSRAIAAQILRHRSFSFQEFSQRYSSVTEIEPIELRKQAETNRQSSEQVIDEPVINNVVQYAIDHAVQTYEKLIKEGVAREQARLVLPLAAQSCLYMKGSVRSWVHYIDLRTNKILKKNIDLLRRVLKIYSMSSFQL